MMGATMGGCRMTQHSGKGRILAASLTGTAVEFYDFYIYATAAALTFPTLFFPM